MGTGFALYLYAGRVSGTHEEVVIEGDVADGFQSPAQSIPIMIRWWERAGTWQPVCRLQPRHAVYTAESRNES